MSGTPGAELILRDTPHTLSLTVYDASGVAVTPDSGTITVTDEAGNTLVNAQAITASNPSTYPLTTTETTDVARLTATWTVSISGSDQVFVTKHEVVAELLFSEVEARAFDNGALSSASDYDDNTIRQGRDRIHDAFESIIGTALGGRYGREVLNGPGGPEVELKGHRIVQLLSIGERAVGSQTFTAYSTAEVADTILDPGGVLYRETLGTFAGGRRNIQVEYEHGLVPIPEDLRHAALWVLRYELVPSNIDRRTTRIVDQTGSWEMLATAGRGSSWYGIPEADAVLNRYRGMLGGGLSVA